MSTRKLPETSHEANKMATLEMKKDHWDKIIKALEKMGTGIYTDIATATGLEPHAVGRRLSELERDQKVWKPGGKKRTPSNRNAYLYQLIGTPVKTDNQYNIEKSLKGEGISDISRSITKTINTPITQPQLF